MTMGTHPLIAEKQIRRKSRSRDETLPFRLRLWRRPL